MRSIIFSLLEGVSVAEVAAHLGVTPAHVRHWRSGRRNIGLAHLERLLDFRGADSPTRARARAAWDEVERAKVTRVADRRPAVSA